MADRIAASGAPANSNDVIVEIVLAERLLQA